MAGIVQVKAIGTLLERNAGSLLHAGNPDQAPARPLAADIPGA